MSYQRLEHAGGAVVTTLGTTITSGDSSLTLAASTGWPTGSVGPFYISVFEQSGSLRLNEEKILVTSRTLSSLDGLTRGQDGTAAADHVAGSIVEHVFTALEADEANATVHATLGQVAAKGDLLSGSGALALTKTAVGADNRTLIADSSATGGLRWATATSVIGTGDIATAQVADVAITAAKLGDASVTAAKLASASVVEASLASTFWHRATFAVTSGSSGDSTIPHGASFTPTFVILMFTAPFATPNVVGGYVIRAIDATNVTARISASQSGAVAGLLASGVTLTGSIVSLA